MKHTRVVSTKCTPGFAYRAFSDTTLVCFIVNEYTTKCSHYRNNFNMCLLSHDDVIKCKHFPCYWPFVRGIHQSPVDSPHKGQWRGALMFSLICAWTNDWANNRDAGGLIWHRAHYDVTLMFKIFVVFSDNSVQQVLRIELTYQLSKFSFSRNFHVLLSW